MPKSFYSDFAFCRSVSKKILVLDLTNSPRPTTSGSFWDLGQIFSIRDLATGKWHAYLISLYKEKESKNTMNNLKQLKKSTSEKGSEPSVTERFWQIIMQQLKLWWKVFFNESKQDSILVTIQLFSPKLWLNVK